MRILVVEDDQLLNKTLSYNLSAVGYSVDGAMSKAVAIRFLEKQDYDLIVLYVNLPDGNGFDFYSERLEKEKTLVILLTARDEENDIVKGLELGAEDYITKPFSVRELVARVNRVLLRRKNDDSSSVIHAGSISYDLDKKEARRDGQVISLSSLENRILDLLFTNHDKAVSRNAVIDCIWEATGNDVYDHTVTVYMKRIRVKLGEDVIKTVKGIG